MKKSKLLLAALAVTLVMTASIGSSFAYFTATSSASGSHRIALENAPIPDESVDGKDGIFYKHVSITNEEGAQPAYIRVKAFAGEQYQLSYSGTGWTQGEDGYYYYSEAVNGGASTGTLDISIGGVPEEAKEGDDFHVIVVYESTPVQYQADGTPFADWNYKVITGTAEGGTK